MTSSRRTSASFRCASLRRFTSGLVLSVLAFAPASASAYRNHLPDLKEDFFLTPGPVLPEQPETPKPAEHTFTLRHIFHHGAHAYPELHRKQDISLSNGGRVMLAEEDDFAALELPTLRAKSNAMTIERLRDRRSSVVDPMVAEARQRGYVAALDASAWTVDQVVSPDITNKDTVLSMALMAANAYVEHDTDGEWLEVGDSFNRSSDFGWELDGLRGHIYSDETNSTIVIGLKGTSVAVFDGDGTTSNDKINDNLFFSCCCGQQGQWTWHQVCNCATDTYTCNNTCVAQALREENRYYQAARELFSNVTELYPDSQIWLTGHSLGGAVTSMLGLTYGLPVVTFEAVPEALPVARLGLPVPPGANPNVPQARQYTGAYHFGHTADPIYIGTCNGATATCSYAGYAMESACHTGKECVYDVVADKGWRVGIATHKIRSVISDVIMKYDDVPECVATPECRDCAQWKMYESNGTESTMTSSSATPTWSRTRTATCETPGWWGCLDTSTTNTATTTTSTSSSSTSTCKTPGWFWCKDKTTDAEATSTVPVTTTAATITTMPTTSVTTTTTCKTPGRFWGCLDEPTTTVALSMPLTEAPPITSGPTNVPTSTSTSTSTSSPDKRKCSSRSWFGFCKQWVEEEEGETKGFAPDEM